MQVPFLLRGLRRHLLRNVLILRNLRRVRMPGLGSLHFCLLVHHEHRAHLLRINLLLRLALVYAHLLLHHLRHPIICRRQARRSLCLGLLLSLHQLPSR